MTTGPYEALLDDILSMHTGRVNTVHEAHARRAKTLYSGCSCGWAGSCTITEDYDVRVPKPCPTVRKIDTFRAAKGLRDGG